MRNRLLQGIFRGNAKSVTAGGVEPKLFGNALKSDSRAPENDTRTAIGQTFSALVRNPSGNEAVLGGFGQFDRNTVATLQNADLFGEVSKNLDRLRAASEVQTTVLGANTIAVTSNTAQKSTVQTLSSVGQSAGSLFGGLTALPLISGIAKLFGFGGGGSQQAPLQKYTPPPTTHFDVAMQDNAGQPSFAGTAYNQFGTARQIDRVIPSLPSYAPFLAGPLTSSQRDVTGQEAGRSVAGPLTSNDALPESARNLTHVTVNVQAMDSRSFLDRSSDIAQAVREAMLNMHSINDVVNDL